MGTDEQTCKILQLSDCTMMYILSYLDATSLFNLSRTCLYFKNIVDDPQLWRYVDARNEPNNTKKVQYVCDRIHDKTSHIFMKAENKHNGLVSQDVLVGWNRLEHLTILALENQRFDGRSLTLRDFPETLEELSLKKTNVKNGKLFFQGSFNAMRHLRVLILNECDWLDSNFFMSVAKYENLEILSIVKCMRLHLNVVPYLNVARHGCKKLKIIDCRFNTVGHEILFQSHRTLLAIYLQSMSSYQLDTGHPLIKLPPMTNESQDLISQSTVKNRSLVQYKYLTADSVEELPYSMLYQDPYPECSCGWKNKTNDEPNSDLNEKSQPKEDVRVMPVDDYINYNLSPQRFICRRHVKELNRLPKDFKNFFYQNQKKFYPDSSDTDSDSDDDRDCCMFGVGKSQQMIILKVREADDQGNLPEPEVINLFRPERHQININFEMRNRSGVEQNARNVDLGPGPSTSRASGSSESPRNSTKRKAEEDSGGNDRRRARLDDGVDPSRAQSDTEDHPNPAPDCPGPSRQREVPGAANAGPSGAARPSRGPLAWYVFEDNYLRENKEKIKLRRLSLRGYRGITDEGLPFIGNLGLDLLDVFHTGVTKEGIEKFLTLNPNCRVVHPNYCVCKPRLPC